VAGLAQSGTLDATRLLLTLGGLGLFLGLAFTLGQRAVDALLRAARLRRLGLPGSVTSVLAVALGAGALTHALGLEAVFGAFVAGVLLGRSRYHEAELETHLQSAAFGFFAPIFFATAGLRVDLGLLADPTVAFWGVVVLAAASASKFAGGFLGAAAARLPLGRGWRSASA
jgi:Kef-type K+ transport system membrane component KefB